MDNSSQDNSIQNESPILDDVSMHASLESGSLHGSLNPGQQENTVPPHTAGKCLGSLIL